MFWWGGSRVTDESRGKWGDIGCEKKAILDRKIIPLCEKDEGRLKQYFKGTGIFSSN